MRFDVNQVFVLAARRSQDHVLLLLCYLLTAEDCCCFDTYIYDVVPNVLCAATSLAR